MRSELCDDVAGMNPNTPKDASTVVDLEVVKGFAPAKVINVMVLQR